MVVKVVGAIVAAYLVGGLPIGLLVGRRKGIRDIRDHGSGNIGASNVLRLLGVKAGILVFVADLLKGIMPVLLARHVLGVEGWWLGCVGIAAGVGHCYSPYLGLSGGRGVSTGVGIMVGLYWPAGVCSLLLFLVVVAKTRYISLGSVIGAASAPVWMLIWGVSGVYGPADAVFRQYAVAAAIVSATIITRHAPNIRRLLAGTERRIGEGKMAVEQSQAEEIDEKRAQ